MSKREMDHKERKTRQIAVQVDPSVKVEFYELCSRQDPEQTPSQTLRFLIRGWMSEQTAAEREANARREAAQKVGMELHTDEA